MNAVETETNRPFTETKGRTTNPYLNNTSNLTNSGRDKDAIRTQDRSIKNNSQNTENGWIRDGGRNNANTTAIENPSKETRSGRNDVNESVKHNNMNMNHNNGDAQQDREPARDNHTTGASENMTQPSRQTISIGDQRQPVNNNSNNNNNTNNNNSTQPFRQQPLRQDPINQEPIRQEPLRQERQYEPQREQRMPQYEQRNDNNYQMSPRGSGGSSSPSSNRPRR